MSPPTWPQPHPYALDFDEFWVVNSLPPLPWPEWTPGDWDLQKYGPAGTVWRFSWGSYLDRIYGTGFSAGSSALIRSLREEASAVSIPLGSSQSWRNPGLTPDPSIGRLEPLRFIRTQIVQAVGNIEQAVHVLHWAPLSGDANLSGVGLKAFGDQVRDSWVTFLNKPMAIYTGGGNINPWRRAMAPLARYTEVRTSAVIQNGPGPWVEYGAGATQIQHPGARAIQDGQTALSPFDPNDASSLPSGPTTLPYEVAMCVSLNTNFRGPRFRGRLYLGPMGAVVMGGDGYFVGATVHDTAQAVGEFIDRVNLQGVNKAVVLSSKFATWAPIQGTSGGLVPDSQRRRRRGQTENPILGWGTPIGGAV
jgi:hypothetical protein